jgi:hypothetical protein
VTGVRFLFGSAPHFIIATSEEKPMFMLNMGFWMGQVAKAHVIPAGYEVLGIYKK